MRFFDRLTSACGGVLVILAGAVGATASASADGLAGARALYTANRIPEAQAAYRQIIAQPKATGAELAEAHLGLGNMLVFQEDYPAAFQVFAEGAKDRRISPRPRSRLLVAQHFAVWGQVHLAERLLREGRAAAAEAAFRVAAQMALGPGRQQAQAVLGLAASLGAAKRPAEAKAELERLLDAPGPVGEECRERSEALLRLVELELAGGDTGAARSVAARFAGQAILFPPHVRRLDEMLRKAGLAMPPLEQPAMGAVAGPGKPIGGGPGYEPVRARGALVAADARQFVEALGRLARQAPAERRGAVLFLPGDATIDLSAQSGIEVPSGVTIASDRGRNGSPGARLVYDGPADGKTLLVLQEESCVSGVRLRGDSVPFAQWPPRGGPAKATSTICMNVVGARCEIENCELARFARGITIAAPRAWIHHNRLLDIAPYPVCLNVEASSTIIEGNDIGWMWHAIAATYSPLNSYRARNNVFREAAPNRFAEGVSGQFAADAHGLGECFVLDRNTFLHEDPSRSVPNRSICIADPTDYAWVTGNWFRDGMEADRAVWDRGQYGRLAYQPGKGPRQLAQWRDLPWHARAFLESAQDFDFRAMAAMPREGSGGAGFWIFQNAYGAQAELLAHTIFSTPEIVIRRPEFRRRPALALDVGTLVKGKDAEWPFYLSPALPRLDKRLAVDVEVNPLPELGIAEVTISLVRPDLKKLFRLGYRPSAGEMQELYRAATAPAPGQVELDPARLTPGIYGLLVEAADRRGVRASQLTWFEVPAGAGRR